MRRIAAEPAWVTEGIFLWWTDDLLWSPELIVWLDLPWRIAARRIVARHARASLAGVNRHRDLRGLARFLRSTWAYYHGPPRPPAAPDDDDVTSRAATARRLAPYAAKVVRCRRPAEVTVFLAALGRDGNSPPPAPDPR